MPQKPPELYTTVDLHFSVDKLQLKYCHYLMISEEMLPHYSDCCLELCFILSHCLFSSWLDPISSLSLDTDIQPRVSCCTAEVHPASPCSPHMGKFVWISGGEEEVFCMLLIITGCFGMVDYIRRLLSWAGSHCCCRHETVFESRYCEKAVILPRSFLLVSVVNSANVWEGIANCISQGNATT